MTVSNSTISGNITAITGGDPNRVGGGIFNAGTATISNSIISGNAAYSGGGIFNAGTATISSSTISGNNATLGGGISNLDEFGNYSPLPPTLMISNSTISGNSSADRDEGGGVKNFHGAVTIVNSIVAGNLGPKGSPTDIKSDSGVTAASAHNLIGDAATAGGLVNGVNGNIVGVDPLLGPLAYNGGPTQTMALLPGSPAIDKSNT